MKIAFRMDDITPDMDWKSFEAFEQLFERYGCYPLLGIVPDNLDPKLSVDPARNFIVTDQYKAIRDAFINRTMEYWTGNTYVPVTKEAIVFLLTDDGWKFSFVEDDSLAQPSGTIRVLGQKMEDLGVQRSSIEYVPAYDPAAYYPHTEYEIVYWNTMVSGIATDNTNVVSRMNYRFAKKTYTAEGSSAEMIYDWGGENEKRQKE